MKDAGVDDALKLSLTVYDTPIVKRKTGRPLVTSLAHEGPGTETENQAHQPSLGHSTQSSTQYVGTPRNLDLGPSIEGSRGTMDEFLDFMSFTSHIEPGGYLSSPFIVNDAQSTGEKVQESVLGTGSTTSRDYATSSVHQTDDLETSLAYLSGLDLRILRCAQLAQKPHSLPLTVASPQVEGIFEATSRLLNVLRSLRRRGDQISPITNLLNCTDRGLTFAVLAVHQRLLHAYKIICASVKECVQASSGLTMQTVSHVENSGRTGTQTSSYLGGTAIGNQEKSSIVGLPAVPMAQHLMVIQLLSHMLNRLSQALDITAQTSSVSTAATGFGNRSGIRDWSQNSGFNFDIDEIETVQLDLTAKTQSDESSQQARGGTLFEEGPETATWVVDGIKKQHDSIWWEIESVKNYIECTGEI
ncbi:hypothetical protein F4678DRAFT_466473 [Xylaria arbuscula]|nr:hypothetical protein F4678DRAFT_466473 [Xylaria arbuscula]